MKKYLLLIPFFLLGSCKLFDIVLNLEHEMNFDINQSGADLSGTKILDPTTNAKFKENIDKIKKISISKITYTISNFDGPNSTIANATFFVADANGNGKIFLGKFDNVNLTTAQAGEEFILTTSSTSREAISGFLQASPNKLTVYFQGSLNKAPAKLNLKLKFYNAVSAGL